MDSRKQPREIKTKESVAVELGAAITAIALAPVAGRAIGQAAKWIRGGGKKNV